jgi:small subunit ribosomal protein S2
VVIPGNDDAIRAIRLVTTKMSDAILEARPLDEALTEGTVVADEAPVEGEEEAPAVPFGAVEQELLRAFGGDE